MEVILKEDVENLGQKGEVVRVAPGYARNFLFPRALAVAATEGNVKNLQHFMAAAEKKREAEREEARKVAEKLAELEIKIEARAGEKNRLFGSITGQQIADVINAAMDLKLDKKKIAAGSGIKMLGKHKVLVTVYPGVTVEKEVEIVAAAGGEPVAEGAEEKPKKGKAKKKVKEEVAPPEEITSSGEIASPPKKKATRNDARVKEADKPESPEVMEESQETTDVSVEESAADEIPTKE